MFLDHILIATNDLDDSSEIMREIGFELTDKGIHRDRGTANRLILFDGEYLELIGVNDLETVKTNRAEGKKCPVCWKINIQPCERHFS